jgi:hypothetical protein
MSEFKRSRLWELDMSESDIVSPGTDYQLTPEFQELKLRAEAAESRLRRIYNSPFWRISKPARSVYSRLSQILAVKTTKPFEYKSDPKDGLPVRQLMNNQVQIEINNADFAKNSFAVIAHWSESEKLSDSLIFYLTELSRQGFEVVLVSSSTSTLPLTVGEKLKSKLTIIRKPNLGYDFGSWSIAVEAFPVLATKNEIILSNDSLIGPLAPLDQIVEKLRASEFDITSVTDNLQLQYHLQSYLLHFKRGNFSNSNIQNFLANVSHHSTKNEVILKYELGLTRVAQLSGLYVGSIFPWNLVVTPGKNPSMHGWERLLELGFPFIKKESLRRLGGLENSKIKSVLRTEYPEAIFALDEANNIKP